MADTRLSLPGGGVEDLFSGAFAPAIARLATPARDAPMGAVVALAARIVHSQHETLILPANRFLVMGATRLDPVRLRHLAASVRDAAEHAVAVFHDGGIRHPTVERVCTGMRTRVDEILDAELLVVPHAALILEKGFETYFADTCATSGAIAQEDLDSAPLWMGYPAASSHHAALARAETLDLASATFSDYLELRGADGAPLHLAPPRAP